MSGISSTAAFSSEYLHPVFREHFVGPREGALRKVTDIPESDKASGQHTSNDDLPDPATDESSYTRDQLKQNVKTEQALASSDRQEAKADAAIEKANQTKEQRAEVLDDQYRAAESTKRSSTESSPRVNFEA